MKNKYLLLAALFSTSLLAGQSMAESYAYAYADDNVTDGDILAEWLVRPVGALGTVVGFATFVAGLPFSVTTDSTEESFDKMVKEPFEYTFHRPVGHYKKNKDY